MNILDKIVAHKRIEVAEAKAKTSIADLEKAPLFSRTTLSLKNALTANGASGVISEFKRKSPSKGIINDRVLPEIVTKGYVEAGACGLSVLTDTEFFGGTFVDFAKARTANPATPMLRKDFMIDEYQLWEAKAIGADVILLIAACLTPAEVRHLGRQARELGLEVLLEVHDREELEQSVCEYVDMVGVNNRNLKTFVTSIETSLELAQRIPDEFVKISESGLKDAETIQQLRSAGYQGFLIGETFMVNDNPGLALKELIDRFQPVGHS
ncbi:indole-3-glycerol phosphate synthase TrpC [Runella slithyformis]|uniref:indole-3-glycerol-phosphate synthase n=1 Tax=Runella slithyformis (strain ATCC 29530 / DSM 19594 / LMG 11500 / NCIMB 11436 / LSU 4) TaxID=761193 RepID=A0A7U3ZKM2_RUNSL|nr:indole-3-glycerol phosphate synthase TrpC [Runella slithyformis]AEI48923.1 Indole-3-glycerol-phosphate synthase [Runella slithyformis DSM 19594]